MADVPTEDAGQVPPLREGHPVTRSDPGKVCEHGMFRADCIFYAEGGPDECYDCGYRDGLDDGRELERERSRSDEELWDWMD